LIYVVGEIKDLGFKLQEFQVKTDSNKIQQFNFQSQLSCTSTCN